MSNCLLSPFQVGYGVVKILSGNQANNEPEDGGHAVKSDPDLKTRCQEEERFIKTQNTVTKRHGDVVEDARWIKQGFQLNQELS